MEAFAEPPAVVARAAWGPGGQHSSACLRLLELPLLASRTFNMPSVLISW